MTKILNDVMLDLITLGQKTSIRLIIDIYHDDRINIRLKKYILAIYIEAYKRAF